ncbi:MAG: nitroreductase family protein [Cupriavidus sp.]|nr:MAG: nitroreductase family protein [Cupriavidus sp.]
MKFLSKKISRIRQLVADAYLRSLPVNSLTTVIYYTLLDDGFLRELRSVLAGKKEHMISAQQNSPVRYTLRRNIHRLEKALVMRPRRPIFALDYIEETVDAYVKVLPQDREVPERAREVQWFTDVLATYFSSVEPHRLTDRLKSVFEKTKPLTQATTDSLVPYPRLQVESSDISYEMFYRLCRQRRSTRWFLDEPVPRETLDKAVLAALQSPSACNRQPFQFRIIDGPSVREIATIPMGTSGYSGNIPVMVAVVGTLDAYFDERDRHVIYVDGALASMSFMLALETLGLASCPINWPDIEEREQAMAKALGLKAWERPIMLMAVGKPDPTGGIPFSEKSPLSCMRQYQ